MSSILTSRRTFGKSLLAATAAGSFSLQAKPNSKFGGVQIGINAPYSFRGLPGSADDVLKYLVDLGISAVELRSQPIEAALGAPLPAGNPMSGGRPPRKNASPEQIAAWEALQKWRLAAKMDGFKQFRKKWNDAGVNIEVVKFDNVDALKDEVAHYTFNMAKAVGAKAISTEIPVSKTKWYGEIAAEHKLRVGYHGHGEVKNPEAFAAPESWEKSMSFSKYNCINLDLGHFTAGNNTSPVPFLKKHADRITHIHLKDRKLENGPNQPWGKGDTPVREVLQLMKKEKYPFQATIEFEYSIEQGSNVLAEIGKCVQFCRESLS